MRNLIVGLVAMALVLILAYAAIPALSPAPVPEHATDEEAPSPDGINRIRGKRTDTRPTAVGEVHVDGLGTFTFDPAEVDTLRPDLFNEGHFSFFDVLVHVGDREDLELEYRFDEDLNTHHIEAVDGRGGWWYDAHYSGGWPERSVFRMDHYPYKDGTTLSFVPAEAAFLESIYETYRAEVARREAAGGEVIVPEVRIRGQNRTLVFENVAVGAHDLRDDVFRPGVITAIDVILTLADAGELSYDLQWYDSLGTAEVVGSYWVNRIDGDVSQGRCGFVYEAGAHEFRFFSGNHNHIPSDIRIINSPEYVEYFWICI